MTHPLVKLVECVFWTCVLGYLVREVWRSMKELVELLHRGPWQ